LKIKFKKKLEVNAVLVDPQLAFTTTGEDILHDTVTGRWVDPEALVENLVTSFRVAGLLHGRRSPNVFSVHCTNYACFWEKII
jgi:hypothetical protein